MFEQEYTRANDRIHPRKGLLKEMEAKWAAEEARKTEEQAKVVVFPTWAKYVSAAAGILLCVGIGMGSVMLFTRGMGTKNAAPQAQEPMVAEAAVLAEEEVKIRTETTTDAAVAEVPEEGILAEAKLTASSDYGTPKGMHPAADEAEVENTVLYGIADRAETEPEAQTNAVAGSSESEQAASTSAPAATKKGKETANPVETQYVKGEILCRGDLVTVFMPTAQQVHVVQRSDRKLTKTFSLTVREKNAQIKRVFWTDAQLLAVQEKNDGTKLLRTDVTDWKAPKHLLDLTQSGTFLGAAEMDGRICLLTRYEASEEEPLPWVNGERMDYADVLLDADRPWDAFAVLTIYDPARDDGYMAQTALLAEIGGIAAGKDRLLLWTEGEETVLYVFSCGENGLTLETERTMEGSVQSASGAGDGFMLLLQTKDDAALVTLDGALEESQRATAKGAGSIRCQQLYEDGAIYLTDGALHVITAAGDRSLAVSGDGFRRLTEDRLLVFSEEGALQLVSLGDQTLEALGRATVKDSMALLVEDPSRLDYDPVTGRLAFPAGQKVYQYLINDKGELTPRGTPLAFYDHNDVEQRELRCLLTEDQTLIFYKFGVMICNQSLVRQNTMKY